MEAVDTFSIIKDIVLGLSAVAVALIAWQGLKTWRKELTGKARFETARNLMHHGSANEDRYPMFLCPFIPLGLFPFSLFPFSLLPCLWTLLKIVNHPLESRVISNHMVEQLSPSLILQ